MNLAPVLAMGRNLIITEDLDPVYCAIGRSPLDDDHKARICLAFWLYYNLGFAADVSELDGTAYWDKLYAAYATMPRESERRYFRGDAGMAILNSLRSQPEAETNPAAVVWAVHAPTFVGVRNRIHELGWVGFGDYFAWKVADMLDRVLHRSVLFGLPAVPFMSKVPKAGARIIANMRGLPHWSDVDVAAWLIDQYGDLSAPPWYDRPIGVAEIETILCAVVAFTKGKLAVGDDIAEKTAILSRHSSMTARLLKHHMPPQPQVGGGLFD